MHRTVTVKSLLFGAVAVLAALALLDARPLTGPGSTLDRILPGGAPLFDAGPGAPPRP